MYLHPWLRTCFIHFLSLDCATRVFDIFVLEGDSFLFRVALAILTSMEARLFNPDKQELEELFLAKDKGAAAVVRREKKRDDVNVWPDEVYEQCGATENSIFAALDQIQWRVRLFHHVSSVIAHKSFIVGKQLGSHPPKRTPWMNIGTISKRSQ